MKTRILGPMPVPPKRGLPKLSEFISAKQAEMDAITSNPTGDLITEPGERIPSAQQIEAMLDEFERD